MERSATPATVVDGRSDQRARANWAPSFVGRRHELQELDRFLTDARRRLLWIHGLGGIGKSALLGHWRARLEQRGVTSLCLDMPSLESFTGHCAAMASISQPRVVIVDGVEVKGDSCVGRLPEASLGLGDIRIVVGSRWPPPVMPRHVPGFQQLDGALKLEPLDEDASRRVLHHYGYPGDESEILDVCRGVPLALTMAARIFAIEPARTPRRRLIARRLVPWLLDGEPTAVQARTLEIAAYSRVLTEELLSSVLCCDALESFRWLSGRSYVEELPHGVQLDPLLAEGLRAGLEWRAPVRAASLARRVLEAHEALARAPSVVSAQDRLDHSVPAPHSCRPLLHPSTPPSSGVRLRMAAPPCSLQDTRHALRSFFRPDRLKRSSLLDPNQSDMAGVRWLRHVLEEACST